MKNGRLVLRLPEGGRFEFGEGGSGPNAEIQLHNDRFFSRGVLGGKVGFGEGYQAGDWDSPDLASVIGWFCANMDGSPTRRSSVSLGRAVNWLGSLERMRHAWNRNSLKGSRRNIRAH